ncbi:hypothetical protein [Pseudomonas sp. KNUC1026]|uniref:hypothetical protein n=1 Tax=Pseudomonas sp. KNUC1026 TaxID=2893890 RepID=UPI001F1E58DE|nr:hypothetical protein [Pseudomonas sp. KNUC1026]UFH51559.1 hypothetical protein LN139_11705 [Pseudomonas sp. KNUC1026]
MGSAATKAETRLTEVPVFAVPYVITTQPDGYLPDMQGFSLERVGSVEGGWYGVCPIEASRALREGEVLTAALVDRLDGDATWVHYTAEKGKLDTKLWPQAFAEHIGKAGVALAAGGWNADNTFSSASEHLRLWAPARYRAFSTAPFANNRVQALACNDQFTLPEGQALCLQVRDLNTQHLYEHHVFEPEKGQSGDAWALPLCEQINRDSRLLLAGQLNGTEAKPAATGNAFWVPQCSELAVTLTEVDWWQAREVDGQLAIEARQPIKAWVYDAFSHRLLADFEWVPTPAQAKAGQWLEAWAKALNASPLSQYVQAGDNKGRGSLADAATKVNLWHRGDALRVFTNLPDAGNWIEAAKARDAWNGNTCDAVLLTVRHPHSKKLLAKAVFNGENGKDRKEPKDEAAWLVALETWATAQGVPELKVMPLNGAQVLAVARFSELSLELQNVGDGKQWKPEHFARYLLEDAVPAAPVAEPAKVSSVFDEATSRLTLEVDLPGGELVFRLDPQMHEKGYRLAACLPSLATASDQRTWPIEVSDRSIVWRGPIKSQAYELVVDCPDALRGSGSVVLGHVAALSDTACWQAPKAVKFKPAKALEPYEASSRLCEDYGQTSRSEVFDTEGYQENGVDERTGMFHAHYPVATLQGLESQGPVCDLTLHYSALRGNEAGLGDGWAWQFSSLDLRERRLTLANGSEIGFTDSEWEQLGKGTALHKKACLVQSNADYSEFTLTLLSGRQEVLTAPSAPGGDTVEPNDDFRQQLIKALKAIREKSRSQFPAKPEHWTQWTLAVLWPVGYYSAAAIDYAEAVKAWENHPDELNLRIRKYERPFVQLMPSKIVSPFGNTLELQWQRKQGQFLLMKVTSGKQDLFKASYTDQAVTLKIWPDTDESNTVSLRLENYLLRKVTRTQDGEVLQGVGYDYEQDPTLDRILCRAQELDGSVEWVRYGAKRALFQDGTPSLPQVELHGLIPGAAQENSISRYARHGHYAEPYYSLMITHTESGPHASRALACQVLGRDRQLLMQGQQQAGEYHVEIFGAFGHGEVSYCYREFGKAFIERFESSGQSGNQALKDYSRSDCRRLLRSVQAVLAAVPETERGEGIGSTERKLTLRDADGRVAVTGDQHGWKYFCYYRSACENPLVPASLKSKADLRCPALPAYVGEWPLMAEYQCDEQGRSLGLTLHGYRAVERSGRAIFEPAATLMVEGVRPVSASRARLRQRGSSFFREHRSGFSWLLRNWRASVQWH